MTSVCHTSNIPSILLFATAKRLFLLFTIRSTEEMIKRKRVNTFSRSYFLGIPTNVLLAKQRREIKVQLTF